VYFNTGKIVAADPMAIFPGAKDAEAMPSKCWVEKQQMGMAEH
jgi:hypothetical protein